MRRRAYLGILGATATAGCIGDFTGQQDSDGDGVPDSEDYAPRDSDVQDESDVRTTTTATTSTTTETTTSGPPDPSATLEVLRREPLGPGYNADATFMIGTANRIDFFVETQEGVQRLARYSGASDQRITRDIAGDDTDNPPLPEGSLFRAAAFSGGDGTVLAEVRCVGEVNSSD